jgi:hypothetical protein
MMRKEEWLTKGVAVKDANDPNGETLGYSKAAGRQGIAKCAAARFLWNIPAMGLPPLIMAGLSRTAFMKRMSPAAARRTEVGVVCSMLLFGVAPALACFKPNDLIAAAKLEPEFRSMIDKDGKPIQTFTFYKGL